MKTPDLRILILREKHGTAYYDVSTDELLHKTCVMVLKRRLDDGWYGEPADFAEQDIEKEVGMSEADIQKLPDYTRNLLGSMMDRIRGENKFNASNREFLKRVQEAFNYKFNPDDKPVWKKQAYHLLAQCSDKDYEYERIDLVYVSRVGNCPDCGSGMTDNLDEACAGCENGSHFWEAS